MWQYNLWKQIQHSCGKIYLSRSTFSYFIYWNNLLLRLTFWKVSVSSYLKRMEQPSTKPYFPVWWSCKGMQSFGKRKVLFICSLVRLFVSLRTDDIPLLEQEIMQIHLVANIFLFSWIKISYSNDLTTSNCSKLSKSVFPFPWIRKYLSFL